MPALACPEQVQHSVGKMTDEALISYSSVATGTFSSTRTFRARRDIPQGPVGLAR